MRTTTTEKRITLSTIKSFIRRNRDRLHILVRTEFDGMVDGLSSTGQKQFTPAEPCEETRNNLGIRGAWFVCRSRDYFSAIERDGFNGYEVTNCCGSFILAVPSV